MSALMLFTPVMLIAVGLIAAIVALAIGGGMAISGASKKAKARRLAAANKRPVYEIPQNDVDNQKIAESRASQGLSDQSVGIATNQFDRALTTTLDTILKGGGDLNDVNKAYQTNVDAVSQLALADDTARLRNIQMLMAQNSNMSASKDKEWQINQYAPYADKAAASAEMAKAGDAQMWQGIQTAGGGIADLAGSMGNKKTTDGISKGGSGGGGGFGSFFSGMGKNTSPGSMGGGSSIGLGNTNNAANRQTMGGGDAMYDPKTNTYNSFDWSKTKDGNRQTLWLLLNS